MDEIEIIATGEKWIKPGVRTISSVLYELIDESQEKLLITAYALTEKIIFNKIKNALSRGVIVEIFIRKEENGYYIRELSKLKKDNEFLYMHIIEDEEYIHSKIIIADTCKVYMGSANLSKNGLYKNYELGMCFVDDDVAHDLEKIITGLIQ